MAKDVSRYQFTVKIKVTNSNKNDVSLGFLFDDYIDMSTFVEDVFKYIRGNTDEIEIIINRIFRGKNF